MQGFWITFTDKSAGYIDAENIETALQKAEEITGKTAEKSRLSGKKKESSAKHPLSASSRSRAGGEALARVG